MSNFRIAWFLAITYSWQIPLAAFAQPDAHSKDQTWKKAPVGDFEPQNESVPTQEDLLQSISEEEVINCKADLTEKEKALGPDHLDVAVSFYKLALAYQAKKDYRNAETAYKRCLAIREGALGPNHRDLVDCLNSYATLLRQINRKAQAIKMEDRARAIQSAVKAAESASQTTPASQAVEKTLNNRAVTKLAANDLNGALLDLNEALKLNPNYAIGYLNRGIVKRKLGDNQGAIEDYSENLRLQNKSGMPRQPYKPGQGLPSMAYVLVNRGEAKYNTADYKGAIEDCSQALELYPNYDAAYSIQTLAKQKLKLGDANGASEDSKSSPSQSTAK